MNSWGTFRVAFVREEKEPGVAGAAAAHAAGARSAQTGSDVRLRQRRAVQEAAALHILRRRKTAGALRGITYDGCIMLVHGSKV